jgi:Zn-dependent peptidase ImmA (M78 family)
VSGQPPRRPLREAARITKMLDIVLGVDRFDRGPVNVRELAIDYSRQIEPNSPIHDVLPGDLPGCVGALVYGDSRPRQWAIMYDKGQSAGRLSFTIGHEFGHYILHRKLIDEDERFRGGIRCDENSITRRGGSGIEQEADEFAAALLMPFHDFRLQLPAKARANFTILMRLAKRYGVSLTATVLRWLEYTETRAIMVVSNEGFARWSKPSSAALKSGRLIRTRDTVYELPEQSFAARREFSETALTGTTQRAGIWFSEPVLEMCFRSDRYDQEITLLQLESEGPQSQEQYEDEDIFDRFSRNGPYSICKKVY